LSHELYKNEQCFYDKSCEIWKIVRYYVDAVVSVGRLAEQPVRWMVSRYHNAGCNLYAFWTALDLKDFLLREILGNWIPTLI
jgi:hypothetical protein